MSAGAKGEHMTAAKMKDELDQLREELTTLAAESDEARRQRAERREAVVERYLALSDSLKRHTKQITPFILLAAVGLGILVGRHLMKK
jgi:septal ring factor EnvC (AmiA/AmiB activator)